MSMHKSTRDASMKELIEYFDEVAPDGLTPGDDGLDLEEN